MVFIGRVDGAPVGLDQPLAQRKAEGKTAAKPRITAYKYPLDLFTARRFREVCRQAMPQ
jgi:hypothetical protein